MDQATGAIAIGLVIETGEFFLGWERGFYFGTVYVSAAGVPGGTFVAFPGYDAHMFDDGSPSGTGTITGGTLRARDELVLSTSVRTSRGAISATTFTLDYDPLYERDSSLSVIAGNYGFVTDGVADFVINVNSNGVVFSQDPDSGCVVNGTVSIINPAYNAYRLELQFSGCRGEEASWNGTTARGFVTLDTFENQEYLWASFGNEMAGIGTAFYLPRI